MPERTSCSIQKSLMSSSVHTRGDVLKQKAANDTPTCWGGSVGCQEGFRGVAAFPLPLPSLLQRQGCKANSASAALNKWLKQTICDGYVMHSVRHSMRDRLRAVNCPSEMIDQIGGRSKRSVGESYGEGYNLDRCRCFLDTAIKQH